MTHRERVLRALNHEEPDRVPIDIGGTIVTGITALAYRNLKAYLGIDDRPIRLVDCAQQLAWVDDELLEHFDASVLPLYRLVDGFGIRLDAWQEGALTDGTRALVPAGFNPVWEGGAYGIKRDDVTLAKRSKNSFYYDTVYHPLADARTPSELREGFERWMPPIDHEEADHLRQESRRLRETGYAVVGQFGGNLLECGHELRGYARFMMDLARGRLAEYLLDLLVERHLENLEIYTDAVGDNVDVIQFGDDFGMQNGLQISSSLYRKVFKPREKKMWDFIKKKGIYKIFLHSCGSIYEIIPDLIEIGLDIINPVQISAKDMGPERLKREFGRDLVFWGGGCDTQAVLPQGTLEEIETHVRENIEIFAPGGGFVFAPVHNVQPDVPPENIAAVYRLAREYGEHVYR